jgi:hypothetical protein
MKSIVKIADEFPELLEPIIEVRIAFTAIAEGVCSFSFCQLIGEMGNGTADSLFRGVPERKKLLLKGLRDEPEGVFP